MSRYCVIKTQFKDYNALIAALSETGGWSLDKIDYYETAQSLFGYHGDEREQKANVIIRRKFVGRASNDIGFILDKDGNYESIISEFDSRKYGEQWINRLKGNYAFHKIRIDMEQSGRNVSRQMRPDGRQRVVVTGYR